MPNLFSEYGLTFYKDSGCKLAHMVGSETESMTKMY